MRTSPRALSMIKGHEGYRDKAYRCAAGVLTIGWGHTSDARYPVHKGMKITRPQAEIMLRHDVEEAEAAIMRLVRRPLNSNQYGALVSLIFNIGVGNFQKSRLLKLINQGSKDLGGAFNAFVKGGRPKRRIPGLVRRRAAEWELFNTPAALADKVVRQPKIVGASEETIEARDMKHDIEEVTKSSPPMKSLFGGAALAIITPILDTFSYIRDSLGLTEEMTRLLMIVVAGAIAFAIYRWWKGDGDPELYEGEIEYSEEVVE